MIICVCVCVWGECVCKCVNCIGLSVGVCMYSCVCVFKSVGFVLHLYSYACVVIVWERVIVDSNGRLSGAQRPLSDVWLARRPLAGSACGGCNDCLRRWWRWRWRHDGCTACDSWRPVARTGTPASSSSS